MMLEKTVAYINGEPVYYAEVLFLQETTRINYRKLILINHDNEEFVLYTKQLTEQSINEVIVRIAMQRAAGLEAERLGFTVTEKEIRDYQTINRQQWEQENLIEIQNEFQKLYELFQITEEECDNTFNYFMAKSHLQSRMLLDFCLDDFIEENYEDFNENGEEFNHTAAVVEYYKSLTANMEIIIDDEVVKTLPGNQK